MDTTTHGSTKEVEVTTHPEGHTDGTSNKSVPYVTLHQSQTPVTQRTFETRTRVHLRVNNVTLTPNDESRPCVVIKEAHTQILISVMRILYPYKFKPFSKVWKRFPKVTTCGKVCRLLSTTRTYGSDYEPKFYPVKPPPLHVTVVPEVDGTGSR